MADQPQRGHSDWDDHIFPSSPRQDSIVSQNSRIRFEDGSRTDSPARYGTRRDRSEDPQNGHDLRRRRSSLSMRIDSIRHAGGVNSFDNFARSWQRAAGFVEIRAARPSFRYEGDKGDDQDFSRRDEEQGPRERHSLLGQQLGSQSSRDSVDQGGEQDPLSRPTERDNLLERTDSRQRSRQRSHGVFSPGRFQSPQPSSNIATSYGTLSSRLNEASLQHANRLWEESQRTEVAETSNKEQEAIFVKRVEREDGRVVNVVVGQSTLPQTVFNSVNVLIGIGLLSLPLGLRYSGWLIGMIFLFLSAILTAYTTRLLAKCLDVDSTLITFADIAYVAYGPKARIVTSILFVIELIAACVALVVLCGDSLNNLFPELDVNLWKLLSGIILIPMNFVPLRILSFSSVLGILCSFSIFAIICIDGLSKKSQPGSLIHPAKTYLFPENWLTLPLSFGLIMWLWGGITVWPTLYRDMRHPRKFSKAVNLTWGFAYLLDTSMAVIGLLMFGDEVRDEVTSSILLNKGYPKVLSVFLIICIAIIPLTKIPLNARPIVSTIEVFAGLDPRAVSDSPGLVGLSGLTRGILKFTIRILVTVVFVIIAILIPSFDRIMAFLGSTMCFTICVVLPLSFYLKIFGKEIPFWEKVFDYILIVICSILAVVGTVWAFLPKDKIGA